MKDRVPGVEPKWGIGNYSRGAKSLNSKTRTALAIQDPFIS